jgi:hypothetical protein
MKTCIVIVLLALLFVACKKSNETAARYQSQGVITGVQILFCPANLHCGGVEIKIKNDTTKNAPPMYLIDTAITALGISPNANFPVNVSLDWNHDSNYAGYIIVKRLKVD